jgi:hypothetical protein
VELVRYKHLFSISHIKYGNVGGENGCFTTTNMCQVVELAVIIDTVGHLLHVQKVLLLLVHETRWNVVPTERYAELTPWNLVVILENGGVSGPPSSRRPSKLLGGI